MRVLHAASFLKASDGVVRQMESEQLAANELGLTWDVRVYCHDDSLSKYSVAISPPGRSFARVLKGIWAYRFCLWLEHRYRFASWIRLQEHHYDLILLRYNVHDPFLLILLKLIKIPVLLVHHTKETDELRVVGGLFGFLRSGLERAIGFCTLRSASGTIGVTAEIVAYEKERSAQQCRPGIVFPNGTVTTRNTLHDRRSALPELLFVASDFYTWHGIDLLLDAIEQSTADFRIHLVGKLSMHDQLRAKADPRIRCYESLDEGQIHHLAAQCHLGLSSFALFRKGLTEACTLKVREYLQLGLPVYAGHKDVFPQDFQYFRTGPLNIDAILQFVDECRSSTRDLVAASAKTYIDKKALVWSLYRELQNLYQVR